MRVLFLAAFPAIGGPLPKLAPIVIDGLRRGGCEVAVVGWSAHTAGREPSWKKLLGRSIDLFRVLRTVRAWRPDVVYVATSHNWPALLRDVPLVLLTTRGGLPVVLHFHGSECDRLGQHRQGLFTALSRCLVKRAAAVLLLSSEELGAWKRFCPSARFEFVLNPYRSRLPRPSSTSGGPRRQVTPPSLLFVGRLVPEKGIFELLDATSRIRRIRSCRLKVAGVGPAQGDMRRRIQLLGLDGDVELLGYLSGDVLDEAYRSSDVLVLPSYREGFPLAVMEAMDYGLPVVTTPIRGCVDHLEPGVNALFVPARDAEALAVAVLRLLDDDALRSRMAAANRAKVCEFAPDLVIPKYLDVLRSVATHAREAG